jgi:hypothetical protein
VTPLSPCGATPHACREEQAGIALAALPCCACPWSNGKERRKKAREKGDESMPIPTGYPSQLCAARGPQVGEVAWERSV